ncbi:uncharacterized protein BKA78DRAFT_326728 [Phyllosticta capitalensis]|uniref:uncharacterized protein n=1 Tax=Phyllosticta capitalensis TaxID=121624 RepID=UPI00312CD1C8
MICTWCEEVPLKIGEFFSSCVLLLLLPLWFLSMSGMAQVHDRRADGQVVAAAASPPSSLRRDSSRCAHRILSRAPMSGTANMITPRRIVQKDRRDFFSHPRFLAVFKVSQQNGPHLTPP